MKTSDNYLKHISEIWTIKEKIFNETERMDFKHYSEYLKNNIKELKNRFKNKYIHT